MRVCSKEGGSITTGIGLESGTNPIVDCVSVVFSKVGISYMMLITIYLLSAFTLLFAAYFIFRKVVRRDYYRKGRLTLISTFSEILIFSLFGASAYIFVPSDWPVVHVPLIPMTIYPTKQKEVLQQA